VLFGGSHQRDTGGFIGYSNSVCILQGDNSVSISDAASQHARLTWTEPIVCAHSAEDGVPSARRGHSAVSWRGKLVLFGGTDGQHRYNDTWVLDVSVPAGGSTRQLLATWTELQVNADVRPAHRMGHTGSLVGDSLYVFGGWGMSDAPINDLWKLDLSAPEPRWQELHVSGTPPAPRHGHAAVVLGDRIVFSGGVSMHGFGARNLTKMDKI